MATRMQQRRGTAAEWAAENPILADGEIGFERDTLLIKMGDGVTPWLDLLTPYASSGHHHNAVYAPLVHPHTKVLRLSHTFTITGEVKVAVGDVSYIPNFYVEEPGAQSAMLTAIRSRINAGTSVTFDIYKNGAILNNGYTATTAGNSNGPYTYDLANGDRVGIVVTAVAGTPKNMSVSIFIDYTF